MGQRQTGTDRDGGAGLIDQPAAPTAPWTATGKRSTTLQISSHPPKNILYINSRIPIPPPPYRSVQGVSQSVSQQWVLRDGGRQEKIATLAMFDGFLPTVSLSLCKISAQLSLGWPQLPHLSSSLHPAPSSITTTFPIKHLHITREEGVKNRFYY